MFATFSYIDPVGSLIKVTYTMNQDGSGYSEQRKVRKNYKSSISNVGGVSSTTTTLSAEDIVNKVIADLTPTVIQVVKTSVRTSTIQLSSPEARRNLVQSILVKLRPVAFNIVDQVIRETNSNHLDAGDLTDLIILELTPVIEKGVAEESQILVEEQEQLGIRRQEQEDLIVTTIIKDLRPTIIRIIQATVAQSDLSNFDGLFQTIITQLRPVVLAEVRRALQTSTYKDTLDAQVLTDRIMS